jgi:ribonuclease-3
MTDNYSKLEASLGYTFKNKDYLRHALTHRSMGHTYNNERFEFFGDALLSVIISRHLFDKFQNCDEGILSRMRSSLVKEATLAEIAHRFNLCDYIVTGLSERKSGSYRRDSILADAVEAIICAIYFDTDSDLAKLDSVLMGWFGKLIEEIVPGKQKDPKSRLQEYLQSRSLALPVYEIFNIVGAEHNQIFTVTCRVSLFSEAFTGTGTTRRRAEQDAAMKVLAQIEKK